MRRTTARTLPLILLALLPRPVSADGELTRLARATLAAAEEIEDVQDQAHARSWAANLLAREGERDEANAAWALAVEAALGISGDESRYHRHLLTWIGRHQASADETRAARDTFGLVREMIRTFEDDSLKFDSLANLRDELLKAGLEPEARAVHEETIELIRVSDSPTLVNLRADWTDGIDWPPGRLEHSLRRAVEGPPPDHPRPESYRADQLRAIALNAYRVQPEEREAAGRVLVDALPLAYGVVDPSRRDRLLAEFAKALAATGRLDEAERLIPTIGEGFGAGEFDVVARFRKALTLQELANALIEGGRRESAGRLLSEALRLIDTIEDPSYRDYPLSLVLRTRARLGDLELVRAVADRHPPGSRAMRYLGAAEVFEKEGEAELAREAIATALALAESQFRDPPPLQDQGEVERAFRDGLARTEGEAPPTEAERLAARDRSLRGTLALVQARAGDLEAAEATLAGLPEGPEGEPARRQVAFERARTGDLDAAIEHCETIESANERANALMQLAGLVQEARGKPAPR